MLVSLAPDSRKQKLVDKIIRKTKYMKRELPSRNSYLGQRAIVVGAGLGGLSAARVLSDYFDEVMILDRDELPDDATRRPGVPQGKQPHGLLGGGLKALEDLFPGFGNELTRAGAVSIDAGCDMLYEVPGQDVWPRIKLSWPTYSMSRPLIERTLRRQVERRGNIKVRSGCRVLNIVSESNIHAATGIQCQMVDGGPGNTEIRPYRGCIRKWILNAGISESYWSKGARGDEHRCKYSLRQRSFRAFPNLE